MRVKVLLTGCEDLINKMPRFGINTHEKSLQDLAIDLAAKVPRSCKLSRKMHKNLAVLQVICPLSCKSCKICLQESCKNIFHMQDSCTSIANLQCKILQEVQTISCKECKQFLARFLKKNHSQGILTAGLVF